MSRLPCPHVIGSRRKILQAKRLRLYHVVATARANLTHPQYGSAHSASLRQASRARLAAKSVTSLPTQSRFRSHVQLQSNGMCDFNLNMLNCPFQRGWSSSAQNLPRWFCRCACSTSSSPCVTHDLAIVANLQRRIRVSQRAQQCHGLRGWNSVEQPLEWPKNSAGCQAEIWRMLNAPVQLVAETDDRIPTPSQKRHRRELRTAIDAHPAREPSPRRNPRLLNFRVILQHPKRPGHQAQDEKQSVSS